jgi:pilus assembly protein CpaC
MALALLLGVMSLPPAGALASEQMVRFAGGQKLASTMVTIGKSRTLKLDTSIVDLVVGDPDIADVTPLTDRSLYVLGKKPGTTSVSMYDQDKRLVGIVEVESAHDVARAESDIGRSIPGRAVRVSTANGRAVLSGDVDDAQKAARSVRTARAYSPELQNNLKVRRPQQVMLEVRFIEAQRSNGRNLGINWQVAANDLVALSGVRGFPSGSVPFGTILGRILDNGNVTADVLIEALEEKGVVRRLAEPNLVAMSGETASFLAGGEIPIPLQGELGKITVDYKKFGVGLNFTPTVLEGGLINLKIEPEVSQIDPTTVVRTGAVSIPGLIVRRASTTIELKDGQSFAIAGLLQGINSTTMSQFPWLGDLPIIGALFRSTSFERKETDLAIIVTPRLVKPARPGEKLRTPLDQRRPGNDVDVFLMGKAEVQRTAQLGQRPAALGGHTLDLVMGER